ncbi:hypothetical protein Taro_050660 [Colocasia esculenta]|uniref:Uncharacterized protein n=1 Tax=Colocasia esculenta TaxID=4460 RepID=A0A843XED1_COLES|nr:hypothetical protein [Colocasia esculenta]
MFGIDPLCRCWVYKHSDDCGVQCRSPSCEALKSKSTVLHETRADHDIVGLSMMIIMNTVLEQVEDDKISHGSPEQPRKEESELQGQKLDESFSLQAMPHITL